MHGRVVPSRLSIVWARLNCGTWELPVQWLGCSSADAIWECLDDFQQRYPLFQLEDELFCGEGGNVVEAFVGEDVLKMATDHSGNDFGRGYCSCT